MLGTWYHVKETWFETTSLDSSGLYIPFYLSTYSPICTRPENYHGEFPLGSFSYLSTTFFTLDILSGYILLPSLYLTFTLSKRLRRPATVLNFWATLAIYSISYSLL